MTLTLTTDQLSAIVQKFIRQTCLRLFLRREQRPRVNEDGFKEQYELAKTRCHIYSIEAINWVLSHTNNEKTITGYRFDDINEFLDSLIDYSDQEICGKMGNMMRSSCDKWTSGKDLQKFNHQSERERLGDIIDEILDAPVETYEEYHLGPMQKLHTLTTLRKKEIDQYQELGISVPESETRKSVPIRFPRDSSIIRM